jgi:hypothetical protein
MSDKPTASALAAAYERVSRAILTGAVAGALERDERLRMIMVETLERLRLQIENDPAWFEGMIRPDSKPTP